MQRSKALIVLDDFYDRTLEILKQKIGELTVGPWDDESADIGPLSSIGARDEIVERNRRCSSAWGGERAGWWKLTRQARRLHGGDSAH